MEEIKCAAFNIFNRGTTLFGVYPPSGLKITKKKGTKHK